MIENFPPLVSIIVTSYNYEQFLPRAIDSAINQSYDHTEIIVVDDGSTDSSPNIIKSYKNNIIPILKDNGGQSSAINAAFRVSKGDIICFLDSDDTFLPQKVLQVVDVFQRNLDIGWCFHPLQYIDYKNNFLCYYPPAPQNSHNEIDWRHQIISQAKHPNWGPPTSGICLRRSLLQSILPLPEAVTQSPDTCLRVMALASEKGFFLNLPLSTMRIHGNNARYKASPQIKLEQASWMRQKSPRLRKCANKNFSYGLCNFWKPGSADLNLEKLIDDYLSQSSVLENLEIKFRAAFHYFSHK